MLKKLLFVLILLTSVFSFAQVGLYRERIVDQVTGVPISSPHITVYLSDGVTPANLFTNESGSFAAPNPFDGDIYGIVFFYIRPGIYVMEVSAAGITTRSYMVIAAATLTSTSISIHQDSTPFSTLQTFNLGLSTASVNGVIYADPYPSLNAAVAAAGSNYATVKITKSVPVVSSITIPPTVTIDDSTGGMMTCASSYTITFNSRVIGPANAQIFGSNCTVTNLVQDQVPVEWFGAVADWNGTTGTDSTAAIQKCVNAVSSGQCLIAGKYKTTAAITISKSNVGLSGIQTGVRNATLYVNPQSSAIVSTSPSADILDVTGAGSGGTPFIGFNHFYDFALQRTVAPTGAASGLSLNYTYGAIVDGVTSEDSIYNFYFHATGSQGVGYIANSAAGWGYGGFTYTGNLYGFYVDSTDGVQSPSLRIRDSVAFTAMSTATTYGLYATGRSINDLHTRNFETAALSYGQYVVFTGGTSSMDLHFWGTIDDDCKKTCLYVSGLTGTLEVNGGWMNKSVNEASPVVDLQSSSNVTVTNVDVWQTSGIGGGPAFNLNHGGGNLITSNNIFGVYSTAAILLQNTSSNSISNNVMTNIQGTSVISLVVSPYNFVGGNNIGGGGLLATNGILLDSASAYVTGLETNNINSLAGNITNLINDSGNNRTLALSGAVTFTPLAASGSGATVTCYTNDGAVCSMTSGMVKVHTGTTPTAGPQFKVSATLSWVIQAHSFNCVVSGAGQPDAASGLLPGADLGSKSSFQVHVTNVPIAATDYFYTYVCSI